MGVDRTENIEIQRGVIQGCVLSSLFFNLYWKHITTEILDAKQQGIFINGQAVNNIRYADDMAFLLTSEEHLQDLLKLVVTKSEQASLKINVKKQKLWLFVKKDT